MPYTFTTVTSPEIPEKIAAVLPALKWPILLVAIPALITVGFLFLYHKYPGFRKRVDQSWKTLLDRFNSGDRVALLNEVICEYCRKGNGVLNPIYRTYDGEPHIEGICNCCGKFVRARLKS